MTLRLYNTLTRSKVDFRPLDAGNVRMYVCGPTVYDFAHIGNARPAIVFDVLFRLLTHLAKQGVWDGGKGETRVTYARNITDVDDKINARAARDYPDLPLNEAIARVTELTERQFHADVAALGCLPPTVEPRATGHIDEMKAMIEKLVAKGCAYVAEDHVLFDVAAMPDYGKLANRSPDEMLAGARVDVAPYKRDAMDFVLWKPSKPGEPAWPSPCGIAAPGRPGWHIECSAMSWKHLGQTFDIHGGGIDLVFPHHENELAQSRCALGIERMASVWMHNGFLQVEGRKMAKSEGNFVTINELLQDWPGPAIRLAMLETHYQQPMNWTAELVRTAREELESWAGILFNDRILTSLEIERIKNCRSEIHPRVLEPLLDDLNTVEAVTGLRALFRDARTDDRAKYDLLNATEFLGIINTRRIGALVPSVSGSAPAVKLAKFRGLFRNVQTASANSNFAAIENANASVGAEGLVFEIRNDAFVSLDTLTKDASGIPDKIEQLIAARTAARKGKKFAEADRIRDELDSMGIALRDTSDGTTWEVKR